MLESSTINVSPVWLPKQNTAFRVWSDVGYLTLDSNDLTFEMELKDKDYETLAKLRVIMSPTELRALADAIYNGLDQHAKRCDQHVSQYKTEIAIAKNPFRTDFSDNWPLSLR